MAHIRDIIHVLSSLALGLMIAAAPVRISYDAQTGFHAESLMALAKSGSGKEGDGGNDDNDDDDDDDDDDNGGRGNRGSGSTTPSVTSRIQVTGGNLFLVYSNGWEEKITNGRYELTDPLGRNVSRRPATRADFTRMREIAGQ